jgi:diguanylate cyclase (GGDEF)-like protein
MNKKSDNNASWINRLTPWFTNILAAVRSKVVRAWSRAVQIADHLHQRFLRPHRPRSIVKRLLYLQSLWAILIYLLAVSGIWYSSNYLVNESLFGRGNDWLSKLDELGTPIYTSRGRKSFQRIRRLLSESPELAYVRYFDAGGHKVLAQFRKHGKNKIGIPPISPNQLKRLRSTGGTKPTVVDDQSIDSVYRIIAPVWVKSIRADGLINYRLDAPGVEHTRIIGFIDVGLDRTRYLQSVRTALIYGSLAIALILFIANYFGRIIVRRALTPLSRLKDPLAKLALGDTGVEVESVGDEEIAAISQALNTTIKAVRERDEELRKIANHDPLTGLVNRSYFMREVESALGALRGDARNSALLFIDLDQFKYVNDTVGHGAGDRMLIQVAEALSHRIREHDVVARFGGDEFIILARDVDQSGAIGIARSILKRLQKMRFVEGEHSFNIHCSIGITMISSSRYSVDELVSQADMACFEAKRRGRNRYNLFELSDHDQKNLVADVGWSQVIRNAIDLDGFVLNFQPMVSADDDGCEMYEVLLRMPDPEGKLVGPSLFFSAAERFGMMVEIDYWVIEHALMAMKEQRANGRDICLSINLSGHVFEDQALGSRIVEALEANDVPGDRVIFEVTEQSAVRYMDSAASLIRSLRNHGCRFALDDFGTGFSSYGYIKNLPIDFIKISGEFIQEIRSDRIDQVMVRSIVDVARALGKKTIAESVEDATTLKMLQQMGVDYYQGRFCGEPVADLPKERVPLVANQG